MIKYRLTYKVLVMFATLALLAGCSEQVERRSDKKIVSVSILPYRYFVKKLAEDMVDVNLMVKPGQSPATYEPLPDQMKALSHSVIYFKTGHLGFENSWMDRLKGLNTKMNVIDCSEGVELIKGSLCSHGHHHDHGDHNHEGGTDPHIWLSVKEVKVQLKHIKDGLISILPDKSESINRNYKSFINELDELKKFMDTKLDSCRGKGFIVYHPAWSYIARDYGMSQHPIEVDGKNPDPGDVKSIVDIAKEKNIRSIVIQSQFDKSVAERIASEIKGKVVMLDPLEENWLKNMRSITQKLSEIVNGND